MRLIMLAVSLLTLGGCTTWPEEGRGGWVEAYDPANQGIEDAWLRHGYDRLTTEHDHLSLKLALLKERGIKQCMPGQLYNAELALTAIKREMEAGLYADAQRNLLTFYHQIKQLERHFELVQNTTGCALDKQIESAEGLERITQLLNSDNQFAFNNRQVTPKYQDNLAKAAELLRQHEALNLLLVGHADVKGNEVNNHELALARAEQVKHWLVIYGVAGERIATTTNGSKTPYGNNSQNSDEKRHSNRRVNAFLIDLSKDFNKQVPLYLWTDKLLPKEPADERN
jgi:outer membrane protein OmpA-like peptidoglycan-associated protein